MSLNQTREYRRLLAHRNRAANWRHWGPYLSERAWGTVREDYSPDGAAWESFPHDHARSRVYRWNEDGLAGISDRNQYLCFALALWNGQDPILKERLFGLSGPEGNHGEDVKEVYFYLDSTPTHAYMRMLYKYPQAAFPYDQLVAENAARGVQDDEFELLDTGIFDDGRYFDVLVEYAKVDPDDLLIRIAVTNRGPEVAPLHVLPTLWFRNTWAWGYPDGPLRDVSQKPELRQIAPDAIQAEHVRLGTYTLYADSPDALIFTENETNQARLYGEPNPTPYVKDAFHRYLIGGEAGAINRAGTGTKAAAVYALTLAPGATQTVRLRLASQPQERPFAAFGQTFARRQREADSYYAALQKPDLSAEEKAIQRQAFAGMLWTRQLYYLDVNQWLHGDPAGPTPPPDRADDRNVGWGNIHNFDVISMSDKWEYPWYAAWDLAFHAIPLVMIDPDYAKRQLTLMTREWYQHPNGQLPAYEWNFSDVNPPVHAWAAYRVYQIDAKDHGQPDADFLEGIFHKLLLNFTWWVNRKDVDGRNIFQGGFLGLDNISLFDRSKGLPGGGFIDQSDGTAWMGFYCLEMMKIALELSGFNPIYEDLATKFFEHFLGIAHAMTEHSTRGIGLWDEEDGFFYDVLHLPDGSLRQVKVRSLVGLMPLLAVDTLEADLMARMKTFDRRIHWFLGHRPELTGNMASIDEPGRGERYLVSVLTRERLISVLRYMLDENEFLSPYGIRSLSRTHADHPYTLRLDGHEFGVDYEPAESRSDLFGGNSNWRGPVWFPLNFLIIESLQKFHHYYGPSLKVEFPTGSGNLCSLWEVAAALSRRLISLFLRDEAGRRPIHGDVEQFQSDPHWRDYLLFHEYFHGDNGIGLGASHQTGWTGLVAKLIQQSGRSE